MPVLTRILYQCAFLAGKYCPLLSFKYVPPDERQGGKCHGPLGADSRIKFHYEDYGGFLAISRVWLPHNRAA